MYQSNTDLVGADLASAVANLDGEYTPMLRASLDAQANALGASREVLQPYAAPDPYGDGRVVAAEILAVAEGVIAITIEQPRARVANSPSSRPLPSTLTLYGIGTSDISPLVAAVAKELSDRFECDLLPHRYKSDRFDALVENGMTPTAAPTDEEATGASLLADPAVRRAALSVATSAGGLLVGDLSKQLDPPDRQRADDIRDELEATGLIKAEFVVICSRNASQVLRAPSRDALTAASAAGTMCACGRELTDERIESAVNLDELGRTLLNGSRWMSVLLIQTLHSLGIEYESMLIDQKSGGDEMDCFADISGELCLFELKDKEFSLGNAYSFGAKVGIHKPRHAIIVTTAHVGNDAKEHFQLSQSAGRNERFAAGAPSAITYVEGLADLAPSLEQLVDSIYTNDAGQALHGCLPFAGVSATSVLSALRQQAQRIDQMQRTEPNVA